MILRAEAKCPRSFYVQIKGGIFMWSIITHFIAFTAGTVAGVVLLCLMQAGKMADEGYENMERRNNR